MAKELGFSLGAWLSSFQIRWFTFRRGRKVGVDSYGNTYYVDTKRKLHGHERRWVLYAGGNDASKVPPEWFGWLHYTMDAPLGDDARKGKAWIKPHEPNKTGTSQAYRPHRGRGAAAAQESYQAWHPADDCAENNQPETSQTEKRPDLCRNSVCVEER